MKRKTCKRDGCSYPVFARGYCKFHDPKPKSPLKRSFIKSGPGQKKRINPVSDYQKETLRQYSPKRKSFLEKNKFCQLRLKGCTINSVCIHHTKGKDSRKDYLDESFWMSSCVNCNRVVEEIGEEAYSLGLKVRKHSI